MFAVLLPCCVLLLAVLFVVVVLVFVFVPPFLSAVMLVLETSLLEQIHRLSEVGSQSFRVKPEHSLANALRAAARLLPIVAHSPLLSDVAATVAELLELLDSCDWLRFGLNPLRIV